MATVSSSPPASRPRSFVRRLLPAGLSLVLLSGAGWAGYHYFLATDQQPAMAAPNPVAHSALSEQADLSQLFTSESEEGSSSPATNPFAATNTSGESPSASIEVEAERTTIPELAEAPQLPPKVNATAEAGETELGETESEPTPSYNMLGDRYSQYASAAEPEATPIEEPAEEAADAEPVEEQLVETDVVDADTTETNVADSPAKDAQEAEEPAEIARGQEPGENPLRASGQSAADREPESEETANPFGEALSAMPGYQKDRSTPEQERSSPEDQALENARPLPQQNAERYGNDRYYNAPSSNAPQSEPTNNSRPFDDSAQLAPQQSAPADTLPQQPAPQSVAEPQQPLPATQPEPTRVANNPPSNTPTPGLTNTPGTGRPGEKLLEGAQSPAIMIQKLAPEEIQVGKRCTFAIRVKNTGQRTAQNIQIHDEVPLGTELVGTAPRATVSGSKVTWDLGPLSVGEERIVEMELIPAEEGELGSVATVTFAAQASAKARCTRPQLALRLSSQPQVLIGEQQIVQIEIANPGSGDATGVMLLETVPGAVSHEAGPALEFEVGTLRAGETKRLELVLTAEQAGRVNNVMIARGDANLQVQASCEFEVIAPELQLSVDGPQRRYLERPATYHVSVDNPGTAAAKEVQLVTHLPKGLQFVSANNMGEYDSSSHSVYWSLAELPANERGTVELVALPVSAGEQTLQVATKAREGLEDRAEKRVTVEGLSALMFEVIDVEGLIEVGGETTYEISVVNQGSKAAANVEVAAIIPSGLRALSGQGETRHTIQGDRVVFAPLPQLAPKADTTFRIQVQGALPGDQRVKVLVDSDDIQQPITKEVSTKVYSDE